MFDEHAGHLSANWSVAAQPGARMKLHIVVSIGSLFLVCLIEAQFRDFGRTLLGQIRFFT
jgi:hypothetical protein